MKILLTNDDGITAQGLVEFAKVITQNAGLFVVAPRTEQSGISQAITFLRPMFPIPLPEGHAFAGYSLDGTPTDCVKLGLFRLCPWKPDLVVSGINGGLNAGLNVSYSGTVGGALAAAMFGVPSIAVSLEFADTMDYSRAASLVWPIIERLVQSTPPPKTVLNINIPTAALKGTPEVAVVPVETNPLGFHFEEGHDPKGRHYFWAHTEPEPDPSDYETDCSALKNGKISVSPISFDLNKSDAMPHIKKGFVLDDTQSQSPQQDPK